ncbi:MAG: integrase arm-type DNA-binding domain-containing protein [Deltaproteobacteria bacterium]|nr:integrase arm-type DNA-binding domain-containing protein [Deltaproteobacteria bacterium]
MAHIELSETLLSSLKTDRLQEEFYDRGFALGGSFGLRVNRGGKRSFFLIYSIGNRRRRMTLGIYPLLSLAAAREKAREILLEVSQGRDPAAIYRRYRKEETFTELAERFLTEHVRGRLKPTTEREYERMIERELLPVWGRTKPSDISPRDVTRLLDDLTSSRGAPVMANRLRALLGKLFQFAIRTGLMEESPVRRAANPNPEPRLGRILTFGELTSLVTALEDESPIIAGVFQFLLLTGQQPKDVLGMEWRNIQFETWRIDDTPTNLHELPLVPALVQTLRALRPLAGRSRFVFSTGLDSHFSHLGRATKALNERVHFPFQFSPRDIRRTFQYRLREIGVRPDVIEKIQNRTSSSPKSFRPFENYDYSSDIREALTSWAQRILPATPPKKHGKIIPLFR